MSIKYVLGQGQRSKGHLFGKLPSTQAGMEAEKRGERGPGAALQRGLARTQGTPGRGVGFTPGSSAERLTGVAHPFAHTAPPPRPRHVFTAAWRTYCWEDTARPSGGRSFAGGPDECSPVRWYRGEAGRMALSGAQAAG